MSKLIILVLSIVVILYQSNAKLLNKRGVGFKDFQQNVQKSSRLADIYGNNENTNSYGGGSRREYNQEQNSNSYGDRESGGVSYGNRQSVGNSYVNLPSYGSSYGNGHNFQKVKVVKTYGGCRSISKTATDFWCNANCLRRVSYCPKKTCVCPW